MFNIIDQQEQHRFLNTAPKEKHDHWTGGGLTEWKRWSSSFLDLTTEFNYDDKTAIVRLKKYTAKSNEYTLITMFEKRDYTFLKIINEIEKIKIDTRRGSKTSLLSDVYQGNLSVEKYLSRWQRNCDELEVLNGRAYLKHEKIETFTRGLSDNIRSQIPFWRPCKETFEDFVISIIKLESEMKRYGKHEHQNRRDKNQNNHYKQEKQQNETIQKHNSNSNKKDSRICYEYQRSGRCTRDNCRFEHVLETNSIPPIANTSTVRRRCRYDGYCNNHRCKFRHEKGQKLVNREEKINDSSEEASSGITCVSQITESVPNIQTLISQSDDDLMTRFWWDSGCNASQTFNRDLFSAYVTYDTIKTTTIGDLGTLRVHGWGLVAFKSKNTGKRINIIMEHVPELGFSLISHSQLDKKGITLQGNQGTVRFYYQGTPWLQGELNKRTELYELDIEPIKISEDSARKAMEKVRGTAFLSNAKSLKTFLTLYHVRLGHVNSRDLLYMSQNKLVEGLEDIASIKYTEAQDSLKTCGTCRENKPIRWSSLKTNVSMKQRNPMAALVSLDDMKLVEISADVCGPIQKSIFGSSYVLSIVVKNLGYIHVEMMKTKSEVLEHLKRVKNILQLNGYEIQSLLSDQGGEFKNNEISKYARENGFELMYTTGYDKNANPLAERSIRTIFETARCLVNHMKVPLYLHDLAFYFARYIRNRLYTRRRNIIPYTELTGRKPNFSKHLYTFGSLSWAWIPKARDEKLNSRQVQAMYAGPGDMFDPTIIGAIFLEISKLKDGIEWKEAIFVSRRYEIMEGVQCEFPIINVDGNSEQDQEYKEGNIEQLEDERTRIIESIQNDIDKAIIRHERDNKKSKRKVPAQFDNTTEETMLRRSSRTKRSRLITHEDYGMVSLAVVKFNNAMKTKDANEWKKAIEEELRSVVQMGTRELVTIEKYKRMKMMNPKIRIFRTRLVLNYKEHENRFKARLVATAFNWGGQDRCEFYSPVVEEITFYMFLNIAVLNKWQLSSWDAKNAFLNGDIPDNYCIFVYPPRGYDQGYVWRLKKALYGLPIASKLWYEHVRSTIETAGWERSTFDPCLFYIKTEEALEGVIIIHVDDFLVAGNEQTILRLKDALFQTYTMKETGAKRYCGINIEQTPTCIKLDMQDYIEKMFIEFKEPTKSSMPYSERTIKEMQKGSSNEESMRKLTGSLLFITKVRPDIRFIVSYLCQYNDGYNKNIYEQGLKVIGYLKKTQNMRLVIKPENAELLGAFDSDLAGCRETRKSRNGIIIMLGNSYLHCVSKKQTCVTDSSTYAETKCLVSGAKWIVFIRNFMMELGYSFDVPTTIWQDNMQTIRLINKEDNTRRARGFDISFKYVCDLVRKNIVKIVHRRSRMMPADVLTKPVGKNLFRDFLKFIGLQHASEEGAQ